MNKRRKPSNLQASWGRIEFPYKDPTKDVIFGIGMSVRETNMNTTFAPSTPEAIEISRLMYREMLRDDPVIEKTILPEYLDYYTTAMIWFRMISLKVKLRQDMTSTEEEVLRFLLDFHRFAIPDPLLMQMQILGSIQTMNGEHLYPVFPELPVAVVANHGGYYGQITVDTHNLYEEIPCLGVLSEAVRQAVSNAAPGAYTSALAEPNITPNANLLGFRPLGARSDEAKNVAFHCGITAVDFPEWPKRLQNTGININFISEISKCLAQTKTFKVSEISFWPMNKNGSIIQVMIQKNSTRANRTTLEKNSKIHVTSLLNESPTTFGAAIMFTPQLWKLNATRPTAATWSCINNPPHAYIVNRNERRDTIPLRYRQEVFRSIPQNGEQFRMALMRHMLQDHDGCEECERKSTSNAQQV